MFGQSGGDVAGDREIVVHLLAEPAQAVGVDQSRTRRVGRVGAAAVKDGTQVEQGPIPCAWEPGRRRRPHRARISRSDPRDGCPARSGWRHSRW